MIFRSLRSRQLAVVLLSVLAAVLVYFATQQAADWCIETWYLKESAVRGRTDALYEQLQADVTAQEISAADSSAVQRWAEARENVSLAVLLPNNPYEAGWSGIFALEQAADLPWQLSRWGYHFYSVNFADCRCSVAIMDASELRLYDYTHALAIVLSAAALVLVLLLYMRWIIRRIAVLSEEVNAVSHGDLDHEIVPVYRDEISSLAQDVETMRTTIIQRARSEQSALQANSDLITALSHDIRNPLTALVGYLELLDMDRDQLPEADREYVRASLEKSFRIRDLTGEMFRYFLVFGQEAENAKLEEYDAQVLLWQLLGECAEDLISRGFPVECGALETECVLKTDVDLLKRVVDNLVSNIVKYADPTAEVRITGETKEDELIVSFRNRIAAVRPGAVESNRVGLRTCEAIMKLLGGRFAAEAEGDTFQASFTLPVTKHG